VDLRVSHAAAQPGHANQSWRHFRPSPQRLPLQSEPLCTCPWPIALMPPVQIKPRAWQLASLARLARRRQRHGGKTSNSSIAGLICARFPDSRMAVTKGRSKLTGPDYRLVAYSRWLCSGSICERQSAAPLYPSTNVCTPAQACVQPITASAAAPAGCVFEHQHQLRTA